MYNEIVTAHELTAVLQFLRVGQCLTRVVVDASISNIGGMLMMHRSSEFDVGHVSFFHLGCVNSWRFLPVVHRCSYVT